MKICQYSARIFHDNILLVYFTIKSKKAVVMFHYNLVYTHETNDRFSCHVVDGQKAHPVCSAKAWINVCPDRDLEESL